MIGPRIARVLQRGVQAILRKRAKTAKRARKADATKRSQAAYLKWLNENRADVLSPQQRKAISRQVGTWGIAAREEHERFRALARWNPGKRRWESVKTGLPMTEAQVAQSRAAAWYWQRVRTWQRHLGLTTAQTRKFLTQLDRNRRRMTQAEFEEWLDMHGIDDLSA